MWQQKVGVRNGVREQKEGEYGRRNMRSVVGKWHIIIREDGEEER